MNRRNKRMEWNRDLLLFGSIYVAALLVINPLCRFNSLTLLLSTAWRVRYPLREIYCVWQWSVDAICARDFKWRSGDLGSWLWCGWRHFWRDERTACVPTLEVNNNSQRPVAEVALSETRPTSACHCCKVVQFHRAHCAESWRTCAVTSHRNWYQFNEVGRSTELYHQ